MMKKLSIILLSIFVLPLLAVAQEQIEPSAYHYRRASLFELLKIDKKDIVFLGSCIVDGAEWAEMFNNSRVKNRGIIGDKTYDVLDRLDPIVEGKPKKVFLLIGINDLGEGATPKEVADGIAKIVERFRKESARTKLYIQSIMPVSNKVGPTDEHHSKSAEVIATNELLQIMCDDKGLQYIDIHTPLAGEDGMLKSEYSNDGVHLMGEGYMVWMKVIKRFVN